MSVLKKIFRNKTPTQMGVELVTDNNGGFYSWNGRLYESDIIRSCIRPKSQFIGKLKATHVRKGTDGIVINPEPYMRFLLEEPNPYMTGQKLQEKMANQLALNNNAFALIYRNEFGYPVQIYPIPCVGVETDYDQASQLYLKFMLKNGKQLKVPYTDVIHLRRDFMDNDLFGESPNKTLTALMNVVTTTDQGVVKAIKNSNAIKWLLKFKQNLKPEDIKLNVKEFVDNFLSIDSATSSAVASDTKYDVEQVKSDSYVPNASQMDRTTTRIHNFFNTNQKIIQSNFNEDEFNAYYEAEIEPLAKELSEEFTRKLFSRKERGFGNKIVFEANCLTFASMATKLKLVQYVDRGMMTPNEVREILNLGPIEGGDEVIRRLDTKVVEGGGKDEED